MKTTVQGYDDPKLLHCLLCHEILDPDEEPVLQVISLVGKRTISVVFHEHHLKGQLSIQTKG